MKITRLLIPMCAAAVTLVASITTAQSGTRGFAELYEFCQLANCADGFGPAAGLIADSSGNLYGTTSGGGANGYGTVFKVTPTGTESVLYSFCAQSNCTDGADPVSALVMDTAGNLYGTTSGGGANSIGTVFRVAPNGTETVLHSFAGSDGSDPIAGLIRQGINLYGTTTAGGANNGGVAFKVTTRGGAYKVLYDFCSQSSCTDGETPQASLFRDSSGNLYGTTRYGGNYGCVAGFDGTCGVVFKITPTGQETVLYSFCPVAFDCTEGENPASPVVMDTAGNLYGTTQFGGPADSGNGNCAGNGCGVIFEIPTNGTYTVLYSFCPQDGCSDGYSPDGGLLLKSTQTGVTLYGNTAAGGTQGVVYRLKGGVETVLHDFQAGPSPAVGGLIMKSGYLYGVTSGNNYGSVFKLGTLGGDAR